MSTPRQSDPAPQRRAVALRYERASESAPRVVAHGRGQLADTILAFARTHAVPVHEDRDLLELLAGCELGAEISPELFDVVARLLVHLYRSNQLLATPAPDPAGAEPEQGA